MNFEGKQLRDEFKAAFGIDVSEMTVRQLWFLTKFGKHVRGRCRSNKAFNNYMNRSFTGARFDEVQKEWQGRTYMGLKITDSKQNAAEDNSSEDE